MATVSVAVCTLRGSFLQGVPIPAPDSAAIVSESLTSSGTSAASTGAIPARVGLSNKNRGYVWRVAPLGDVWVTFAGTPTAAAGTDYIVPSGSTAFFVGVPGDKIAVVDAT